MPIEKAIQELRFAYGALSVNWRHTVTPAMPTESGPYCAHRRRNPVPIYIQKS